MLPKQEADALMVKHGGNKTRVAGELGIQRATLRNILNGDPKAGTMVLGKRAPAATGTATATVTMGEIMAKYNPVTKVKAVLAGIPSGEFLRDADLAAQSETSQNKWSQMRNREELKRYRLRTADGATYWGSPEDVNKAKAELLKG
jgi:hypothetical protein